MAGTDSYTHVITPPDQIYQQRQRDNGTKTKARSTDSIEVLAEHQRISLEKTIEIATELSSDILIIHNMPQMLDRNLRTLDNWFCSYLGGGL
jgi:adenylate kinase